jgi:mannose-6-phosphate isomerase-like protein (cupin superfamily)
MKAGVVYNASTETLPKEYIHERGNASCFQLLTAGPYAEAITVLEIHLTGNTPSVISDARDTLIFVREGSATLIIDGDKGHHEKLMDKGSAALVTSGASFTWSNGAGLKAVEISIPDRTNPYAKKMSADTESYIPFVHQGEFDKGKATGNREFEVLYGTKNGSSGATMFIGFIPPSGAPLHYHLYDEVCHIVSGGGELEVEGELQELLPGSTFMVSPRLLHSVRNSRNEDLWILGTFRPPGSPAAAFYPDGTPAPGYNGVD